jgi:hypothetical protein
MFGWGPADRSVGNCKTAEDCTKVENLNLLSQARILLQVDSADDKYDFWERVRELDKATRVYTPLQS